MLDVAVKIKGEAMSDIGVLSDIDLIIGNGTAGNSHSPINKDLDLWQEFQISRIGALPQNEITPSLADGVDLIVGSGPGGMPLVNFYDGIGGAVVKDFYGFRDGFSDEVRVASDVMAGNGYRIDGGII